MLWNILNIKEIIIFTLDINIESTVLGITIRAIPLKKVRSTWLDYFF